MKKHRNVVRVPRPSGTAYNPDRPLERNLLIKHQVEHFRAVEMELPPDLQTGIDIHALKTEGEASAYVRKVTEAIHANHARTTKVRTAT